MTKVRTGGPEGQDGGWAGHIDITDLDPGTADSGYWDRFRFRVMTRAAAELARRRAVGVTVGHVLENWSRMLVPLAAAAAAAALVLIWRGPPEIAPLTMGIEEALTWDLEDDVLPTLLGGEGVGETSAFIFASETF